ncbi:recombinase family protein [Streptomyces sp. NPDC020379]|uniref:recombinase family protein n=1 Tax=Streptomyces sp. NPDC020379 TaxID=3365071 RepID=UPI003788AEF7
MAEKKTVAVYLKALTIEDVGTSLISQQRTCHDWAERNGYVVEKDYSELPEEQAHTRLLYLIRSKKHRALVAAENDIYGATDEQQREVTDVATEAGVLLFEAKYGHELTSVTRASDR